MSCGDDGPDKAKTPQRAKQQRKPRVQVLINGETFSLGDKPAFIMHPDSPSAATRDKPWVFYAPALTQYPDAHESWMHQQILDQGITIAGINVGEAYGSPLAMESFDALHQEMIQRGFRDSPVLLGRSRGGLWVSSYAIRYPHRVAAIAGIYPVLDFTTYPGIDRAASAYGFSPEQLAADVDRLNPIARASELATAKIPVYIIHGNDDKVVPIEKNSAALGELYRQAGAEHLITLERIDGQGHSFWEGYFHCQPLVDFVVQHAK
tara:strand:- start:132 stop:923 length:792 start_codon:yes stop_codon:yes gene_type:complete